MGKARFVYELSFFVYLASILVRKFLGEAVPVSALLIACGIAALFELLYIAVLHRNDMLSFGRTLAMAGVFLSIDVIILIAIFAVSVIMRGSNNVATVLSNVQLSDYYNIPTLFDFPGGNIVPITIAFVYIIAFYLITKKLDRRYTF